LLQSASSTGCGTNTAIDVNCTITKIDGLPALSAQCYNISSLNSYNTYSMQLGADGNLYVQEVQASTNVCQSIWEGAGILSTVVIFAMALFIMIHW